MYPILVASNPIRKTIMVRVEVAGTVYIFMLDICVPIFRVCGIGWVTVVAD